VSGIEPPSSAWKA